MMTPVDTLIELERTLALPQTADGNRVDWERGVVIGPDYNVTPLQRTANPPGTRPAFAA